MKEDGGGEAAVQGVCELCYSKNPTKFFFLFFLPLYLFSLQSSSPEMQHIQMLQHSGKKSTHVTNDGKKARRSKKKKKPTHFPPPMPTFSSLTASWGILPFLLLMTRAPNRTATPLPFPPDYFRAFRHWHSTQDTDDQHSFWQFWNKSNLVFLMTSSWKHCTWFQKQAVGISQKSLLVLSAAEKFYTVNHKLL